MSTTHYKTPLFLLFILFTLSTFAQPIKWKEGADETYIFEISNKEALKLLKTGPNRKLVHSMLHSPKGELTETWKNTTTQGHFIYAHIHKNKVNYQYTPIIPFQVFLYKEYGAFTLQVVDRKGDIRSDAKVKLNRSRIYYDPVSQTYTVNDESSKEQRILTVELDGFRAFFDLRKHFVSPQRNYWNGRDDTPDFYSYLITDKNKYKPGETVRFKSYALTGGKRPINKDLDIWMRTSNRDWKYKKIGTVSPHNPGGFAGEIQLHDSLKLVLDQQYVFQLRDRKGRIVANTSFRYEDYELYDSNLDIKLTSWTHYYPHTNTLEIMATDVNGLPLPDMRAEVTVLRKNVIKSYTDVLILPDTLFNRHIELDASVPTVVDIPASLFGESDCAYEVTVLAYSPDNQRLEKRTLATYYRSSYDLRQTVHDDKIRFEFYELGASQKVEAELSYNNGKDKKRITLPYEETFNQSVNSYNIDVLSPHYQKTFNTHMVSTGFQLDGGIEDGTLNLSLQNPLGLEFTWYVYEGNTLIQKGAGNALDFVPHQTVDENKLYYLEIFYYLGGTEKVYRRTFSADPEYLRVHIDLPERIYPGQEVNSTVTVKDYAGNPVPKVDLTAFSYNSMLNYYVPDLPYYGREPEAREQRASYSMSRKSFFYSEPLDYDRWNKAVGLDKMAYYQFTYPRHRIFTYEVDTPDSVTQFAPYVMKDGEEMKIWVIEQNDVPIYFSWTEQPKAYSFSVNNHSFTQKIALRLHDRLLIMEPIHLTPGRKTILSIDIDHLPPGVREIPLSPYLTDREKQRYGKLTARFPRPYQTDYAYLTQKNQRYLIYQSCFNTRNNTILAGPIPEGYSSYNNGVRYKHAGGFSYQFEDNIVYKESDSSTLPSYFTFFSSNDFRRLNDFYLSPKVLQRVVERSKRGGYVWHPQSIYIAQQQMNIHITLPAEKDSTGVSNLLFQQVDSGKIVFPDRMEYGKRKYSAMPHGTYNVILLYNNGKYLKQDSIQLNPHSFIELHMNSLQVHESDSLSGKWLMLGAHSAEISGPVLPGTSYYRPSNNTSPQASGVSGNVSGYVYDSTGEPLIGASILVKGTMRGTVTDLDGYFTTDIDANHNVLQVNYIGYIAKEITVTNQTQLSIVLEEDAMMLDEVVVVGYGTIARNQLSGSVSGISADAGSSAPPAEEIEETEDDAATKEAEERLYNELLTIGGLRRNFSDVGFWEPRLYTDKKGKAQFSTTFPDNITKWEAVVYAMNRKLQTGTARKSIRSYKPLMAELKTPQFLTVGDSCNFTGVVRNYTKDAQIDGHISFVLQQDSVMNTPVSLQHSHTDKLPVNVASDTDSITAQYLFTRNDGYMDGEERSIVVVPQGAELAEGTLTFLRNDEVLSLNAADNEKLHITITGQPLDIYMDAAAYLTGYQYACNEQLASKLIGMLNCKLYAEYTGEKFEYDQGVKNIIKRLVDNQNDNGLWSWWNRQPENISYWMSAHILRALAIAKDAGYKVEIRTPNPGNVYIHKELVHYKNINLNDIETLHALSQLGAAADYAEITDTLFNMVRHREIRDDSIARKHTRYYRRSYLKEKLLIWEIQQKEGASVGDSLLPYLKEDIMGAVYCSDDKQPYSWYANELQSTLIAYRIIKKEPALAHLKEPMQIYILGTKKKGWNTYQASSVLATILPDLLNNTSDNKHVATINLRGKHNAEVTTFPYETTLAPGQQLQIQKKDGIPLICSVYSIKRMVEARKNETFDITTKLDTDVLTAGIPVKMKVALEVKKSGAEHAMIEVPIPAGCSYASKQNYNYYYGRVETHREHFKERTVIFCERLPVGKYEFTIELLPRYTGNYILNPAKVELMYLPLINANNDMRKVRIEERE